MQYCIYSKKIKTSWFFYILNKNLSMIYFLILFIISFSMSLQQKSLGFERIRPFQVKILLSEVLCSRIMTTYLLNQFLLVWREFSCISWFKRFLSNSTGRPNCRLKLLLLERVNHLPFIYCIVSVISKDIFVFFKTLIKCRKFSV